MLNIEEQLYNLNIYAIKNINVGMMLLSETCNKFPDYFPENCPPLNAKKGRMIVYRWVSNNPANISDFICNRLVYPNRIFKPEDELISYGLSTFREAKDLDELAKYFSPKLRSKKFKYKAKGLMIEDYGVYLDTPKNNNSHVTWWIYNGVLLNPVFKVFEGDCD